MKKVLSHILIVATVALAVGVWVGCEKQQAEQPAATEDAKPSVDGKWTGIITTTGPGQPFEMTLAQSGNEFTGVFKIGTTAYAIEEGSVSDSGTVKFSLKTSPTTTFKFTAALNEAENQMAGNLTDGTTSYPWSAVRG